MKYRFTFYRVCLRHTLLYIGWAIKEKLYRGCHLQATLKPNDTIGQATRLLPLVLGLLLLGSTTIWGHDAFSKNTLEVTSWGKSTKISTHGFKNATTKEESLVGTSPEANIIFTRDVDGMAILLPADPEGFLARGENGQVVLSWDPPSVVSDYIISRATSLNGTYTEVTTVSNPTTTTSYTDTDVTNGTLYYYRLVASSNGSSSSQIQGAAEPADYKFSVTVELEGPSTTNIDVHGSRALDVHGSYTATSDGNIRFVESDGDIKDGGGTAGGVKTDGQNSGDITITPTGIQPNQFWYFYYDDNTVAGYPERNTTGGSGTGTTLVTGVGNTPVTIENTGQDGNYCDYLFYVDRFPVNETSPELINLTTFTLSLPNDPAILDDNVEIIDEDNLVLNNSDANYYGFTVTIKRSGAANINDVFAVNDPDGSGSDYSVNDGSIKYGGKEFATYSSSDGIFILEFLGLEVISNQELVNAVAQNITINPGTIIPGDKLEWTLSDGENQTTVEQDINGNFPFITTWETTTANETIKIPTRSFDLFQVYPNYDFTINWGDGSIETITGADPDPTHSYNSAGEYQVSISGTFPAINLEDDFDGKTNALDSSHKCNITLIVDDCRKNLVGGHEPMSFSGSVV